MPVSPSLRVIHPALWARRLRDAHANPRHRRLRLRRLRPHPPPPLGTLPTIVPLKFRSRTRLAALPGVNTESI